MSLLRYVFTNRLSTWGLIWRTFLWLAIVLVLACVWGYVFFASFFTTAKINHWASTEEFQDGLAKAVFLKPWEFISLSASGFQTNKTGLRYETPQFVVAAEMDKSCEEVFDQYIDQPWAFIITPWALCVASDTEQQVVTADQILSLKDEISQDLTGEDLDNLRIIQEYTSGFWSIFTSGGMLLDHDSLHSLLVDEIPFFLQDPEVAESVADLMWILALVAVFVLMFFWVFVIVWTILFFLIWLFRYSLCTWIVAHIWRRWDRSYTKAISITRLPLIVFCIVMRFFSLPRWQNSIIFMVLMAGLFGLYYKSENGEWTEDTQKEL